MTRPAENPQPPNMIKYLPPPEQAQPAPKMIQSVNIESVNIVPPPESHPPQKMSLISLQPAEPTNSQINAQNNASSFSIQPSDKPITIEPGLDSNSISNRCKKARAMFLEVQRALQRSQCETNQVAMERKEILVFPRQGT